MKKYRLKGPALQKHLIDRYKPKMDTTPPLSETISSTSIIDSVNENIGDIENKDTEMSQLEQDPTKCNNININKRARQNSGQRNPEPAPNIIHRNTAVTTFGIVGANAGSVSTVAERPIIRDHRMSVSDSGDSEPPRTSDLDIEPALTPTVETGGQSVVTVVSDTLESDGDVRTDDEEVCSMHFV